METPARTPTSPLDTSPAPDKGAAAAPPAEAAAPPAEAEAPQKHVKPAEDKLLTTGEMARLSSSTLRTVRFYEEEGILRPAKRTDGGHRLFDKDELDRLLFVSDLRTAGLSLDEIKEILELKKTAASGPEAAREVRRILAERILDLEEKLTVLTRLRDEFIKTREMVTGCVHCRDENGVPVGCNECTVVTTSAGLPRSARVVWGVGNTQEKSSSRDAASACDGGAGNEGPPAGG